MTILNVKKKDGTKIKIKINKNVSDKKLKSEPNIMLKISDIAKFKIPYNTKIPKVSGWQYSKTTDIKASDKTNVG